MTATRKVFRFGWFFGIFVAMASNVRAFDKVPNLTEKHFPRT